LLIIGFSAAVAGEATMIKSTNEKNKVERNVAKALSEVPIDNKEERDALRARLRQKYAELKPLKVRLSKQDRDRLEELGEIIDLLEECESRAPQKRSGAAKALG
jgi:uncharacterized lipoprotein YehR (DUF1307 family)